MAWTFTAVAVALVFFRADSLGHAAVYLKGFVRLPSAETNSVELTGLAWTWLLIAIAVDWLQRSGQPPAWWTQPALRPARWAASLFLMTISLLHFYNGQEFIYFQF
jgi:hypothetical protein